MEDILVLELEREEKLHSIPASQRPENNDNDQLDKLSPLAFVRYGIYCSDGLSRL